MDPFTIALATFGIQKLRGKSTKRSLRDAAIAGGIGQFAGMAGVGPFQAFGKASSMPAMFQGGNFLGQPSAAEMAKMGASELSIGQQMATVPSNMGSGIQRLIGEKTIMNEAGDKVLQKGSGFMGLGTGEKLGVTLAGASLLGEDEKTEMPEGTKPEDYKKAKEEADKQIANILDTYDYEGEAAGISPYSYQQGNSLYTFHKGGIAEIKKFNQGGINYLPSKSDHDEKDYNNYIRAKGYVEDGSGNGDKDEDTMLAQLADGEFVSRADAILGAGIMEGANPSSYKDMRKKGAAFFYGQQAKFKRIFDLLDAARKEKN
tara:strand:- start:446 stop:1396 length:951 start_codon:yes stop_codon:yes gene_type:complete